MKRMRDMFEVIGVVPQTNHSSIGVFSYDGEYVEIGLLISEHSVVETKEYKVYSTGYGDYFNYKGRRYYLNEFCRC